MSTYNPIVERKFWIHTQSFEKKLNQNTIGSIIQAQIYNVYVLLITNKTIQGCINNIFVYHFVKDPKCICQEDATETLHSLGLKVL